MERGTFHNLSAILKSPPPRLLQIPVYLYFSQFSNNDAKIERDLSYFNVSPCIFQFKTDRQDFKFSVFKNF